MIEISMEGKLEKESERSSFSELLKLISEQHMVKLEDYDTLLSLEVCPEGVIECSFEGVYVSVSAQTNVAGPGFHACTARIFDDILMQSGIAFEVNDPTMYYENRDFEALKYKYFYPWLQTIASHILDDKENGVKMCISWSVEDYQPLGRDDSVVTPMGYIKISDFMDKESEELAEQFFIWNHETRDASYFRNCALSLLWKECYFEYSMMNAHTDKISNMILDYMEAAYEEDTLIDLPYDIYEQLCDVLHREKLLHGQVESRGDVIGYRKDIVFYALPHWRIPCNGFAEKTFDRITQSLNLMAPYRSDDMPWEWLLSFSEENTHENLEIAKRIEKCNNVFDINQQNFQGKGCIENVENYYMMYAYLQKDEDTLYINGVVRAKEDIKQMQEWIMKINYKIIREAQMKN